MDIYTYKKPKASNKDSDKKSLSSNYNLPDVKSQIPFCVKDNKTSNQDSRSKSSNDRMPCLFERYKSIVHYNSSEPKKYVARAFTKNSEIYIAPGEESALPHELAHVYQQKTQSIPVTGKINGEKVNTDSKLEKDADEISKNIDSYIPRAIISGKRQTNSNNVIQFVPPNEEGLPELTNEESEASKISFALIRQKLSNIIPMLEKHPCLTLTGGIASAVFVCWLINRLKERKRIKVEEQKCINIDKMLNEEKIFDDEKTFEDAQSHILANYSQKLNNYITRLKRCCDAEGVKSVLQGANTNVSPIQYTTLLNLNPKYFMKRLELITAYIEKVYKQFNNKYWIRSTGSDPHQDAQHALFLISKITNRIISVYKPHDMSADAAVVGQNGMFAQINK